MAFNGNAGSTYIGATPGIGTLEPSGSYVNFPLAGALTTDTPFWQLSNEVGPRRHLHALHIDGLFLAAWNGGALNDPALAHVGRLMSGSPVANSHGLPVNFGPNRGRWLDGDLARLLILICDNSATGYVAGPYQNAIPDLCSEVTVAGGNVTIDVFNRGKGAAGDAQNLLLHINLLWIHTVEGVPEIVPQSAAGSGG